MKATSAARRRRIIDVKARCARLERIAAASMYDPVLRALSRAAPDVLWAIRDGQPGAVSRGGRLIRDWNARRRELAAAAELERSLPMYRYDYRSASEEPAATSRGSLKPRTVSLPRTRSREMSHAPRRSARSTPKTASRSGDSGDSDPAGSSAPRWRRFIVDSSNVVVAVVA